LTNDFRIKAKPSSNDISGFQSYNFNLDITMYSGILKLLLYIEEVSVVNNASYIY